MADNGDQTQDAHYVGRFTHNVDASRRIKLPSKWRRPKWPTRFMILPWPLVQSNRLLVLTPARWQQVLDSLQTYSLSDEDVAATETLICSEVMESALDESGRLSLSARATGLAGIERQIVLVGRINKFELWPPERFANMEAQYRARSGDVLKKVHL